VLPLGFAGFGNFVPSMIALMAFLLDPAGTSVLLLPPVDFGGFLTNVLPSKIVLISSLSSVSYSRSASAKLFSSFE
jgi:hypothetical protein